MKSYVKAFLFFPWTLWCLVVLIVIMVIAFPVLALLIYSRNRELIRKAHDIPPAFARVVLLLWGIRVQEHYAERKQPEGQYIFVSNHMSYLDAFIAATAIPNYLKFLGKAEVLRYPVFGFVLKHLYVPVQRDDKGNRAWSMEQMKEKMKDGGSMFLCPEGTCNVTGNLLAHFHDGAFKLSVQTQTPLVPLTFIGTGDLLPRSLLYIKPGLVQVYWHAPIPSTNYTMENLEDFKEEVKRIMRADLAKHYPAGRYSA